MPESARDRITSNTSRTISGSSAEVGSSNSMIFGCMAKALAIATRCCCPPDNCPGYLAACARIPTLSNNCNATSSAFGFAHRRTQIGASVTFCKTVK